MFKAFWWINLLSINFLVGTSAFAGNFNLEYEHVPSELIVKFKKDSNAFVNTNTIANIGAKALHGFRSSNASLIRFSNELLTDDLLERAKFLSQLPNVEHVEANTIIRTSATFPNDDRFNELYGMHNNGVARGSNDADIDAPEAWDLTTGSRDVLVAVIDTGIDYTHPDIAPNYWTNPGETGLDENGNDKQTNGIDDDNNGYVDDFRGWDFANNDNDPMDDNDHGTHCAGTIGASGNDGIGVSGVNWQVSMVGVKFLTGGGSGSLADAVRAIEYTTSLGVHLSSNSWGGGGYSQTMADAITAAEDAGILFIAAAGNSSADNDQNPHYPSSYENENIIAVAATDYADTMANFSCYGATSVDLAAPGVEILSTVAGGRYDSLNGTSMATPHVSGVAALIYSAFPGATATEVKNRILNTVDPVASLSGKTLTGGRLNAFNSLEIDTIAPGTVQNLEFVDSTLNHVSFKFTKAGDDGDIGSARRYEARISEQAITDANWNSATPVVLDFEQTNDQINATLTDIPMNFSGFVALKAVDNVGNVGETSDSLAIDVKEAMILLNHSADSMDDVVGEATWNIELDPVRSDSAFSDSPNSQYINNQNDSLEFPEVLLSSNLAILKFDTTYDLENNYDFVYVEVSVDGGTWTKLDTLGGTNAWTTKEYSLADQVASTGGTVKVRLRLKTDQSVTKDGIKVDNLYLYQAM